MTSEPGDRAADQSLTAVVTAHLDRHARRPRDGDSDGGNGLPDDPADSARPTTGGQLGSPDAAFLNAITEELRSETRWSGPPAGVRESLLASVRARAAAASVANATAPPAMDPGDAPSPVVTADPATPLPAPATEGVEGVEGPRPRRRWRPLAGSRRPRRLRASPPGTAPSGGGGSGPRRRRGWTVPVAVLGAAAFTVAVLAVDRALAPDPPRAETYVAVGTGLAPGASADVSVVDTPAGIAISLVPVGLPAAAPGSYYSAWLRGPDGSVPIGSFHWRRTSSPIELWSGVDIEAYPTLVITLQAEGDPPSPSSLEVLTATLTP